MPTKTISAHLDTTYNIDHNNRRFVASNVDEKRCDNNYNPVMAGKIVDGKRYATIDEIYDRIFESDWRKFQSRQRPARRYNGTYLEYIREHQDEAAKNVKSEKEKNKRQHEAYEIVFQVGKKDDTGYNDFPDDFKKASALMKETTDYILSLPYVITVTENELNNPEWKPPENCIVVLNCVVHNDETCPGIHFTMIPYASSDRGAAHQNLLKQTFNNLGYPTKFDVVLNDSNMPIPKTTKNGKIQYDDAGKIIYEKGAVKKGPLDWMDDIKSHIAEKMKEEYDWDRADRIGSNNHLDILEYKIKAKEKEIENLEEKITAKEQEFQYYEKIMIDGLTQASDIYEKSLVSYKSEVWEEYRNISENFWDWYRKEKERIDKETERTKKNKNEREYIKLKAEYYKNLFLKSGNLIFAIAAVILRIFRYFEYDSYKKEFDDILREQRNLTKLSKEMSGEFYNIREELKRDTTSVDLIEKLKAIEMRMNVDYNDRLPEYSRSYEILTRD